ncbi:MAG: ExbD/TolR family protein [Hydrogenophilaceae bacterium]|nr:ExbD/TolR family protein [Hydrogenophilaceae bacterium]
MPRVRKQVASINVVPLIDVMLVLLVVFMITAPFINPGQVELPSVGKTTATPSQPLEVMIRANGDMALRDRARGGEEVSVTSASLAFEVKRMLKENQPVVISADKSVRYEEVMNAMSALQAAQVSRIGLLAKPAR